VKRFLLGALDALAAFIVVAFGLAALIIGCYIIYIVIAWQIILIAFLFSSALLWLKHRDELPK
jgi:membrane protein implicated in regulation of membrane protease activity